jgi:hypothetical protein
MTLPRSTGPSSTAGDTGVNCRAPAKDPISCQYATRSWRRMTRRRDYRRTVAGCTYRIEAFWTAMTGVGFCPEAVALVPRNDLDERYAYFPLSKPR